MDSIHSSHTKTLKMRPARQPVFLSHTLRFVILFFAVILTARCSFFRKDLQHASADPQLPSITIEISSTVPDTINKTDLPYRVYVSESEGRQVPAQLIVKVRGAAPGEKVVWAVDYHPGPERQSRLKLHSLFQGTAASPYDSIEMTSQAGPDGEASVLFTTSTYAGDRFQLGADIYQIKKRSSSFHKARFKTAPFVVWKKIYFEAPKVLKNVRFPAETWQEVRSNLARMHLELQGPSIPQTLDPSHPELNKYFTTSPGDPARGNGQDPRYGPSSTRGKFLNFILSEIANLYEDGNPTTVNIIILGCLSMNSDLIQGKETRRTPLPQPVDYEYHYQTDDLDLREVSMHGMGMQMGEDSPAIYVWSDFWWMASRVINIPHEKALCRVILHELGHHILNQITLKTVEILDDSGHILENRSIKKTIMSGFSSLQDSEERRRERVFINKPEWHSYIEWLIRKYFIAAKIQ